MSAAQDKLEAGYDVVVVGGGAAGCVVAARLSGGRNRRVWLLEAGPDHRALMPGRRAERLAAYHRRPRWGYVAEPDAAGVPAATTGQLLGGCSSANATFALRHPADYDAWASR
jgi:choline dehydrogenase